MEYPTEAKICCPRCAGLGFILVTSSELMLKKDQSAMRVQSMQVRNKLRDIGKETVKSLSLRKAGELVGISSPQRVKHHLMMLETLGWSNYE